jgi:hypothetical protein
MQFIAIEWYHVNQFVVIDKGFKHGGDCLLLNTWIAYSRGFFVAYRKSFGIWCKRTPGLSSSQAAAERFTSSSGEKPIDMAKSLWSGRKLLQDVVTWLECAVARRNWWYNLSTVPSPPDKETLAHPPVSSQLPSPSPHPVILSSFDQKSSGQTPIASHRAYQPPHSHPTVT